MNGKPKYKFHTTRHAVVETLSSLRSKNPKGQHSSVEVAAHSGMSHSGVKRVLSNLSTSGHVKQHKSGSYSVKFSKTKLNTKTAENPYTNLVSPSQGKKPTKILVPGKDYESPYKNIGDKNLNHYSTPKKYKLNKACCGFMQKDKVKKKFSIKLPKDPMRTSSMRSQKIKEFMDRPTKDINAEPKHGQGGGFHAFEAKIKKGEMSETWIADISDVFAKLAEQYGIRYSLTKTPIGTETRYLFKVGDCEVIHRVMGNLGKVKVNTPSNAKLTESKFAKALYFKILSYHYGDINKAKRDPKEQASTASRMVAGFGMVMNQVHQARIKAGYKTGLAGQRLKIKPRKNIVKVGPVLSPNQLAHQAYERRLKQIGVSKRPSSKMPSPSKSYFQGQRLKIKKAGLTAHTAKPPMPKGPAMTPSKPVAPKPMIDSPRITKYAIKKKAKIKKEAEVAFNNSNGQSD